MTVSGNFVGSAFCEYRPVVMAQAVSTRGPVTGTATGRKKRRKPFLLDLYSTAVGKKYAMALSGIALMGYVLVHSAYASQVDLLYLGIYGHWP